MKLIAALIASLIAGAAAAPANNQEAAGPDPSQVYVQDIIYGGTGNRIHTFLFLFFYYILLNFI